VPDQTTLYTLTPPVGAAVVFNNGTLGHGSRDDMYYLSDVQGLDSADIRAPRFKQPLAHGARQPVPFLEDGLEPRFEGMFVIQSVYSGNAIRAKRMQMYDDLKTCLRNCLAADGTLTWTESGVGARSLAVRYQVRLAHTWSDEFQTMLFAFGMSSTASQPS
jgi:hypothetical protein